MEEKCKPDDPAIENSEQLLRRIPDRHYRNGRILHGAFEGFRLSAEREKDSSPELCLAHMYPDGFKENKVKKTVEKLLKKNWTVASFITEIPRNFGQTVYPDVKVTVVNKPFDNEAHVEVCGIKDDDLLEDLCDNAKIVLEKSEQ